MMKTTMLGISGFARSGKDSFANATQSVLRAAGIVPPTVSFAGYLKNKINAFLVANAGISAWTRDDKEKLIIRPMLVAYGAMMRSIDQDYWVNSVKASIEIAISEDHFPIVTDVRYENEAKMIQSLGGKIIVIKREDIGPANNEEAYNQPLVESIADKFINVPKCENPQELYLELAKNTLQEYKII